MIQDGYQADNAAMFDSEFTFVWAAINPKWLTSCFHSEACVKVQVCPSFWKSKMANTKYVSKVQACLSYELTCIASGNKV